jgi:hypothetical protein
MRRKVVNPDGCRIRLHGIEHILGGHALAGNAIALVHRTEQMPHWNGRSSDPHIDRGFSRLGIGTERTRAPLPIMSTITQRPWRCWMLLELERCGFLAAQTAGEHHRKQGAIAFAFEGLGVRFIQQCFGQRHTQPIPDEAFCLSVNGWNRYPAPTSCFRRSNAPLFD